MARSLVTGAGGFIGSHLVRALIARGDEVHALLREQGSIEGATAHSADIADAAAMQGLFETVRPEQVFHLAASNIRAGVRASSEEVVRTNVLGTENLLAAAETSRASSFISMGSFLEYGAKSGPAREDMVCEPPELYATTKLAATLLTQSYGKTGKLNALALRLFTPYGPGMQEKRLVREALERALRGDSITLTSPKIARDFIYIDDIVALLIEAAGKASEHRGEIFNLGSGERTTLEEFSRLALETTKSASSVEWGAFGAVSYDSEFWQADMTKTCAAFSWRPRVSLREGLEKTVAWLSEHP